MTTRFARYVMLAVLCAPLAGYAADAQLRQESKEFSDAAVAARVKAALAKSQELNAARIEVRSAKGAVTLTGVAQSQDEADRAADLVQGVKGVVTVQNKIQVAGSGGVGGTQ